ncbi:MAG: DUF3800 domain-containing protein [Pyrinomonadaceae bacterium]
MIEMYSPVRHYAMAVGLSRWRKLRMLNLTAYFDETGEVRDSSQRFNGMAGAFAPAEMWLSIENDWNALIAEFGFVSGEFHTTDIKKHRREIYRQPFLKLLQKAEVFPLGWIVSMDMLRSMDQAKLASMELEEPYMQAFRYCLFWPASVAPVTENSLEEEVVVMIDEKVRFRDKVNTYYQLWRQSDQMGRRIPTSPAMRSSQKYMPLQAADLIAGVLKDEAERRMYKPDDEPQASFTSLLSIAERSLHRTMDAYRHLPFCVLLSEDDLTSTSGAKSGMETKEIEMKNDGKDAERFQSMLKTVVSVPKEDVKKHEVKEKAKKKS